MNHIAHFLLAPQTDAGAVGTLLADFHRGAIAPCFPPGIAEAIALHRRIDAETDGRPQLHALKAAFVPGQRRFAGVALDLYFDHCLVREWPRHADVAFDVFVDTIYRRLRSGLDAAYVPERMRGFAAAMRDYDWLRSYREFSGVEAALGRLNVAFRRRFQREVDLRPLANELLRLRPDCDAAFEALFPHLQQLARTYTRPAPTEKIH